MTENEATEQRRKLGEDSAREETRKEAFEVAGGFMEFEFLISMITGSACGAIFK